jgi:hypothetical protein
MSDQSRSLEDTLTAMAESIAFPPEPNLAPAVRARIEVRVAPVTKLQQRTSLRLAVAALALTIVASGVLFFSPTARHAVAGWLGVPGIEIRTTPGRAPNSFDSRLHLGPRVTLAQANARLGEKVRLPSGPGLGVPDAIHAKSTEPIVWLAYRPSDSLPAVARYDIGLLVTEIRSDAIYGTFYKKLLGPGGNVRNVSVNGTPGFWVHGQPHTIQYRFPLGIRMEEGRISGNSLIWVSGGITYRLELAGGLHTARTIAASLR